MTVDAPPLSGAGPEQPVRNRLALAVGVTMLAAAVAVTVGFDDKGSPTHPGRWDPRVAKLADFVESERELEFRHPVAVDFLGEEEFVGEVTADAADVTGEEREELGDFEALARSLALVGGDIDLFEAVNAFTGAATLAFYDPETDRVKVRGTRITVGVEATLVHELTHALQDQYFDLTTVRKFDTDAAESAFDAVVEGDASRVESAYLETLPESEVDGYNDELAALLDDIGQDTADVPEALAAFFQAPYVLGEPFIDAVAAAEGIAGINRALREPPTTEEHLLDAATFLEGEEAVEVEAPPARQGDRRIDDGDFGTLTWLFVLAGRIDPLVALVAVEGWGGDAYVAYERDGRVCTEAVFVGDRERDTDEMELALRDWVRAGPEGASSLRRRGEEVHLNSCDPGVDDGPGGGDGVAEALTLAATRAEVLAGNLAGGVSLEAASCVADGVLSNFDPDELASPELPPGFEERMTSLTEECAAR